MHSISIHRSVVFRRLLSQIHGCCIVLLLLASLSVIASDMHTLIKKADAGDTDSQYELAHLYHYFHSGKGSEAVKYYRLAADSGHKKAQQEISKLLFEGKVAPIDKKLATHYYALAYEETQDSELQLQIANLYAKELKDYTGSVKWYRRSAEQGQLEAQNRLGLIYFKGLGVDKDEKEAAKYLIMAADQDLASAQYMVGNMYFNGIGVDQDLKVGASYIRLSAEQNHTDAQLLLASVYQHGFGIKKSNIEAYKWLDIAARLGSSKAYQEQMKLARVLKAEEIDWAEKKASKWLASMNRRQH